MLNTFVGGPLNGRIISTADLLKAAIGQDILAYSWTKELIPTRTGERARVWQAKDHLSAEVAHQVSTPNPKDVTTQEDPDMSENVEFTALETKRRESGISRAELADRIGGALGTISKVYRIERAGDDSKRTSDDERAQYTAALDALIAEKNAKAVADAEAAAAAEPEAVADEAVAEPVADEAGEPETVGAIADPNAPAF